MKERLFRFRSFWIFPLLALGLIAFSYQIEGTSGLSELPWLWLSGILIWTLLEYGLHRHVFHIHVRNATVRRLFKESHLQHHDEPRDRDKILVHPAFGLVISAAIYLLLYSVLGSLYQAAGVMAGIWTGFLYYEAVHYRVHLSKVSSPILQRQRRAHFYHHFSNSDKNFGVTSPLWDYVFRTHEFL
jgi:sterol desaturase/sphingolipid hydroxylase (fatty acid hydroxylase superfamily)